MNKIRTRISVGCFVLVAAAGGLIGSIGTASAAATAPLSVSVGPTSHILARGAAVNVPVTVVCPLRTAGVKATLQLTETVSGKIETGVGEADVTCTGQAQLVVVPVIDTAELAFTRGSAFVSAQVDYNTDASVVSATGKAVSTIAS